MTLRDRRLEPYQRLFHISRCLPRYWADGEELTRADLRRFRESFHDWYFGEEAGGMYLTPDSKALYLELQNALVDAFSAEPGEPADAPVSAESSAAVRRCASALRHQLVEDVGAAQPPRMRWVRVGQTEPPPRARPAG